MIADDEPASADNIVTALRAAFKDEGTKGIVLRINSPGGSPVQSGYIYDEIRRLRGEHPNVKVYAVISDLGASGAYYIASAADQIYADKASLVGSIGVTAASFGFVGTMEKLGVERRVYTSGEHKSFLDPFQPQKPEETQFWQQVLDTTHKQFIDSVKRARRPAQGRGASGAVLGSGLVRRTGIAARFDRRSGQCQLCGARSGEGEEDRGLHRAGVAVRSLRQEVRCQCGGAPRAVDGLAGAGTALRAFPSRSPAEAGLLYMGMPDMGMPAQGISTPSSRSMSTRRISGRPTRLVASSPSVARNRLTPRPSALKLPAQSSGRSAST